ncbi:hypothetical protein G3O08_17655 [Cryomorpha ignava]|uniref:Uncharacterized protein n=1 Tax=Cryomorpha ignava TaxID=101383 RepID=A0A7K3WV10_9FLAO|nr:hypothetical protein [Cryomorpha ignava]NEN25326.1 hypothetical protein [Cryomorpha ignava]
MKSILKVRLVLIVIFLIYGNLMVIAQNRFVSVADFNYYLPGSDLGSLEREFDLLKILLLDSSKQALFFEYDPELKELFFEYSKSLQLSKKTFGFVTDLTNIKLIFEEPGRIFNSVFSESVAFEYNYKIDQPIYINENKAIVEILSPTTSDIYYLRINEGVVQINWLGGVIK